MKETISLKSEWYLGYEDGTVIGPLHNYVTSAGLGIAAQKVAGLSSPYLVIGDDLAEGDTIAEVFRKSVSVVTQLGNAIRLRTVLLAGEGNGQHQKTCIFTDATDAPGSGTMFNLLKVPWGKENQMILTVECRLTLQ
ncbi:MAG: hypothetical protein PHR65_03295 [Syntrophomonadaceae bacterium]|nr:hypothetical protein [Syntrophomonadaceae bacterium]